MQTTRLPYELLFRWNADGTLSGAHVQWRLVIYDDTGAVIGETVTPPVPLSDPAAAGFPLSDLPLPHAGA